MSAIDIRYLGWSSVAVTMPGGIRLYVDGNFTSFNGERLSTPADYSDPDLLLVTHGHFDHCQDLPSLARGNEATVITSPPIEQFFVRKHGLSPDRVRGVVGGTIQERCGLTLTAQGWTHRILRDRWPALLARKPGGLLRLGAALRCFLSSPLLGFRVESPGAPPLTLIGEAFQAPGETDRLRELGTRAPPGVTLIALEPGLEIDIARATAAYRPSVALVYSGHAPMWDYFGLPRVDFALYRRSMEELAPEIPVGVLEPGDAVRVGVEGILH